MIEADKDRFRALMMQVAVDKRYQDNLDRAAVRIMFEALKGHCTIEDLEAAAPELLRTSKFFPRVDEWLAAVEKLPAQTVAGLLPGHVDESDPTGKRVRYCDKCQDEGWVFSSDERPARVVKCSCRDVNPALGAGQRRKRRSEQ